MGFLFQLKLTKLSQWPCTLNLVEAFVYQGRFSWCGKSNLRLMVGFFSLFNFHEWLKAIHLGKINFGHGSRALHSPIQQHTHTMYIPLCHSFLIPLHITPAGHQEHLWWNCYGSLSSQCLHLFGWWGVFVIHFALDRTCISVAHLNTEMNGLK